MTGFGGGSMRNDENRNAMNKNGGGRLAEDERWRNSLRRPRYSLIFDSVAHCDVHSLDLMTAWRRHQLQQLLLLSRRRIICLPFVVKWLARIGRHSVRLITITSRPLLLLPPLLRQPTTTTITATVRRNQLRLASETAHRRRRQGRVPSELLLLPRQTITRDNRPPGTRERQIELIVLNPQHLSTEKNWWRKSHKNSAVK